MAVCECSQCKKQKMLKLLVDIELYLCELPGDIFCAHRPIEEYHALLKRIVEAQEDNA